MILSTTGDGFEAPCTLPLDWVKERVTFMDLQAVREWVAREPYDLEGGQKPALDAARDQQIKNITSMLQLGMYGDFDSDEALQAREKLQALRHPETEILDEDRNQLNDDRAEWAASALCHFQCCTGAGYEDTLTDLLADLMHWADRNGVDFNDELARARMHNDAEISHELARADGSDERYPGMERETGGPGPEQDKGRSR